MSAKAGSVGASPPADVVGMKHDFGPIPVVERGRRVLEFGTGKCPVRIPDRPNVRCKGVLQPLFPALPDAQFRAATRNNLPLTVNEFSLRLSGAFVLSHKPSDGCYRP